MLSPRSGIGIEVYIMFDLYVAFDAFLYVFFYKTKRQKNLRLN